MSVAKPMSPNEVDDKKIAEIPQEVFDVFDKLIAKNWDGNRAIVKQPEVVEAIIKALTTNPDTPFPRHKVFYEHYLDVEHAYRKAGWKVEYDKPAYYETHDAYFVFSKKKSKK